MGYIVHKGSVVSSEDFDLIENFAAEKKTKVVSAELWAFDRLPIGQLCVKWKNGAIGFFVGGDLSGLREYVESLPGWPKPVLFSRSLPYSAGCLFVNESSTEGETENEEHAAQHIVRHRNSETGRRRRTRQSA